MITRDYAMQFMNRPVAIRTNDGRIHRGVLQSVTADGIYLRPVNGTRLAGNGEADKNSAEIKLLQQLPESELHAQEVFWPFFFFPFLFLLALWPLAFWW